MMDTNEFDRLISEAREELQSEASGDVGRLQELATWWEQQRGTVRWVRGIAVVAASLWVLQFGYAIWFLDLFGRPEPLTAVLALVLPPSVLWGAAVLAGRPGFSAQLLSRSLLIATTMVGSASSLFQNASFDSQLGLGLGWSTTRVLVPAGLLIGLTLGGHGLTTPHRHRERGGFEMVLSLSLVMGVADAMFLAFVAAVTFGTVSVGPWPFVLPIVLMVAAHGLFRGRVWGLLLMALTNLAEVLLVLDGSLLGDSIVTQTAAALLVLTATIQLLLPVPVYAAMLAPRRAWVERLQATDGSLARILTLLLAFFLALAALASTVVFPMLSMAWEQGLLPRP
ncbi:MAG: hypothetical protein ACRBN8_13870 [Nannocystales bacterium]